MCLLLTFDYSSPAAASQRLLSVDETNLSARYRREVRTGATILPLHDAPKIGWKSPHFPADF
jgi:hypothetical protein